MAKVKINVSIDDDLLREVDDYCDQMFINRSYLICQQLKGVVNMQKIVDSIRDVSFAIRKFSESGEQIDDDLLKQIKDFETVAKMLVVK